MRIGEVSVRVRLRLVAVPVAVPCARGDGFVVGVAMVLVVHGGPWARDTWGLSSTHQWLANRGYAVLSVNFRGSTGFGKAFVNAANLRVVFSSNGRRLTRKQRVFEEMIGERRLYRTNRCGAITVNIDARGEVRVVPFLKSNAETGAADEEEY